MGLPPEKKDDTSGVAKSDASDGVEKSGEQTDAKAEEKKDDANDFANVEVWFLSSIFFSFITFFD